jgi:hypothetical protein
MQRMSLPRTSLGTSLRRGSRRPAPMYKGPRSDHDVWKIETLKRAVPL